MEIVSEIKFEKLKEAGLRLLTVFILCIKLLNLYLNLLKLHLIQIIRE